MKFLINGISLAYTADECEFCHIAKSKMKRAADPAQFHFCVYKKSVDARRRDDIRLVCSVLAEPQRYISPRMAEKIQAAGFKLIADIPEFRLNGVEQLKGRPLVIGCGPAGLFCALVLAKKGYRPIVVDRGGSVWERKQAYTRFCNDGILDKENNIQFGAGGAGTFSDGKLTTRINDPLCAYVLSELKNLGAPEDVTLRAKPHIGTDLLETVVANAVDLIKHTGGDVIFHCRVDDIRRNSDGGLTVKTTNGDMNCGCAVLAVGHSARDTYAMLMESNYTLEAKPFSVGVRIEHLRSDIEFALYGELAGDKRLGHAEYNLSDTSGRGVYTFCMCPGGEIVAAATEDGGVVVNGMSRYARDGVNSNSAIAVTIRREDYGNTPTGAIEYQRLLEKKAYMLGGGKYYAPMQTVGDFLTGDLRREPSRVMPTYMQSGKTNLADLSGLFPNYITEELRRGIVSFGKRIRGFDASDAVLTGVESRTSSPIRIPRNEALISVSQDLVYPCGEGAGYAGGITSAAVDGLRVASAILERFAPLNMKEENNDNIG